MTAPRPGRRARFRQRAAQNAAQPPPARDASPDPPAADGTRTSRLLLALALLGGILIGQFIFARVPLAIRELFDYMIAAGFALTLTLTYRAWIRRQLAARRARGR